MDVQAQLEARWYQDDLQHEGSSTGANPWQCRAIELIPGTRYLVWWVGGPSDDRGVFLLLAPTNSYAGGDISTVASMLIQDGDRIIVSPATDTAFLLCQARYIPGTLHYRAIETA